MKYVKELESLIEFVRSHPGLTAPEIEKSIKEIPWPKGDPKNWHKMSLRGTRLHENVPSISSLLWKLRYLEITGDVKFEGKKWYAATP